MEQNPTWVRLQPDPVGTDYSVIFKVTEQESEGDETTSQDWEEGRMGASGLVGAMSQHTIYLTWRTQLSLAKWSRRANRGHMGDVCPKGQGQGGGQRSEQALPRACCAQEDRVNSP